MITKQGVPAQVEAVLKMNGKNYPVAKLHDSQICIVSQTRRIPLTSDQYTTDSPEPGQITVQAPATLPTGCYGLEVTGDINGTRHRAFALALTVAAEQPSQAAIDADSGIVELKLGRGKASERELRNLQRAYKEFVESEAVEARVGQLEETDTQTGQDVAQMQQQVQGIQQSVSTLNDTVNGKVGSPGLPARVDALEQTTEAHRQSIAGLNDTVNGKVGSPGLPARIDALELATSAQSQSITGLNDTVNGKNGSPGLPARIDALELATSAQSQSITGLNDTVNGKGGSPGLTSRVTALEQSQGGGGGMTVVTHNEGYTTLYLYNTGERHHFTRSEGITGVEAYLFSPGGSDKVQDVEFFFKAGIDGAFHLRSRDSYTHVSYRTGGATTITSGKYYLVRAQYAGDQLWLAELIEYGAPQQLQ